MGGLAEQLAEVVEVLLVSRRFLAGVAGPLLLELGPRHRAGGSVPRAAAQASLSWVLPEGKGRNLRLEIAKGEAGMVEG